MPQGRASVVELFRGIVVAVAVPQLPIFAGFASCAASCPGPVSDEAPAAVKQEAEHTRGPMLCIYLHALRPAALVKGNWIWLAARAGAMTSAGTPTSEEI